MKRLLLLLSVLFWGCDPATLSPEISIYLSIDSDGNGSRSFAPTSEGDIAVLEIDGTGPYARTVDLEAAPGGMIEVADLICGEWAWTVAARNADGVLLYEGSETVFIESDGQAVSIELVPAAGDGSLLLVVDWDEASYPGLIPEAFLEDLSGSAAGTISLSAASEGGYSGSIPGVASGFYLIRIQLKKEAEVISGRTDVVRILQGIETAASVWLSFMPDTGGMALTLTVPELGPLPVEISGGRNFLSSGGSLSLSATTSTTATVDWYKDGQFQQTGTSYTLTGDGGQGPVLVQAVAMDGDRAGSGDLSVTLLDATEFSAFFPGFVVRDGDALSQGAVYGLEGLRDLCLLPGRGWILGAGYEKNRLVWLEETATSGPLFMADFSGYDQITSLCPDAAETRVFSALKGTEEVRCDTLSEDPVDLTPVWSFSEGDFLNPEALCLSEDEAWVVVAAESGLYSLNAATGVGADRLERLPGETEPTAFESVAVQGDRVFAGCDALDVVALCTLSAVDGTLTFDRLLSEEATTGLKGAFSFAFFEDKAWIAGYGSDSIGVFSSDSGGWSYLETVEDGEHLNGCRDLLVSGTTLLAAAGLADEVSVFSLDAAGIPVFTEAYSDLSSLRMDAPYTLCSSVSGGFYTSAADENGTGLLLRFEE